MAYLVDHPPRRSQFRAKRRTRPTGATVVHTAEGVLDTVGPDTGAENVAGFIRRRADPGSYHDLVDSDSAIQLVPYGAEAFQDGTGSNPWAMSLSFALKAADWPRLTAERRDAFLRQGVVAVVRQQRWLRANGYPTTPLRRISKADSDRGVAGFISHGDRDPARRTDPGRYFPWARFFELIRKALSGALIAPPTPALLPVPEGPMYKLLETVDTKPHRLYAYAAGEILHITTPDDFWDMVALESFPSQTAPDGKVTSNDVLLPQVEHTAAVIRDRNIAR